MIAASLSLLIALAAGLPAARLADPDAPIGRLLGEGFLFGIAICSLSLFALSLCGVPWTRTGAFALLLLVAVALALRTRRGGWTVPMQRPHLIDLLTLATLAGYALYATIAPPAEIDFIATWGLKARIYALHGGIDWAFLTNEWYLWGHQDYPPLLPLAFDWMTLLRGSWDPVTFGLLYPALSLALLLIVRSWFADELGRPWLAAAATFAIAPLAISPWIGIADGPLVAFATAGILLLRRAIQRQEERLAAPASLLIGFAALTKNEGLALIGAVAIAVVLTAGSLRAASRLLARMWPALALAAPWLVIRAVFGLTTDMQRGPMLARVAARLRDPLPLLRALATWTTGEPLLWIGIAAALILSFRRIRAEAFALLVVAAQTALYLGAYLATQKSVDWHVRWSWERLVSHLTLTLAFVAIVLLSRNLPQRTAPADA